MLQNAFASMPQGGGQLNRTALPDMSRPTQEPIDLGAGGPPPGSERGNWLSSLGGIAEAVAPMVGGAMSAGGAKPTTQGAGGWSNPDLKGVQLPGSTFTTPQLGPATSFQMPTIDTRLSPSTPRPFFSFGG